MAYGIHTWPSSLLVAVSKTGLEGMFQDAYFGG